MKIGYIRVSTQEQNTVRQEDLMERLGVELVYMDKLGGKARDRPALQTMMGFVRAGDTVVVESISRFARNTRDLLELIEQLRERSTKDESPSNERRSLPWSGNGGRERSRPQKP